MKINSKTDYVSFVQDADQLKIGDKIYLPDTNKLHYMPNVYIGDDEHIFVLAPWYNDENSPFTKEHVDHGGKTYWDTEQFIDDYEHFKKIANTDGSYEVCDIDDEDVIDILLKTDRYRRQMWVPHTLILK